MPSSATWTKPSGSSAMSFTSLTVASSVCTPSVSCRYWFGWQWTHRSGFGIEGTEASGEDDSDLLDHFGVHGCVVLEWFERERERESVCVCVGSVSLVAGLVKGGRDCCEERDVEVEGQCEVEEEWKKLG